jgi:uncharacterized RDD family membrane protein YckC
MEGSAHTRRSDVTQLSPHPEHVPIGASGPRASFGQRLAAAIVDAIIVGIPAEILLLALARVGFVIAIALGVAYYGWLEGGASGQTVGKRVMKIRVYDFRVGGPIGTGRGIGRYFARIISAIPCLLGYWWMLWDKERQCWHDKLVGSVVVPADSCPVDDRPG